MVQPPLEPRLESAHVLLPNSGKPSLVVKFGPADDEQTYHMNIGATSVVEFCSEWNSCHVYKSSLIPSTASSAPPTETVGALAERTNGGFCAENRHEIPSAADVWCNNTWRTCPVWDPEARTCTFVDISRDKNKNNRNFSMGNHPCWFRVTVLQNSAYNNNSALLRVPPHYKLYTPDPVRIQYYKFIFVL